MPGGPNRNLTSKRRGPFVWLCGLGSLYAAALLAYSQTLAFTWDESFHLLAAQLIVAGRRPYLDFCFPQAPLNVYWNAAWMRLLGHGWRVPHFFAALATIAAVLLMAAFAFFRLPVRRWRFAAAVTVGLAIGLNAQVFIFGSLGQSYGFCLFALAVALHFAVRAVDRSGVMFSGGAGFFAGAAAAASLLSVAAVPTLLVWSLVYNRAGSRWRKSLAFCVSASVPFAPVIRLFFLGPRQTWFNLVQYHVLFRRLYWPDTTRHDLDVLTSWIDSGQALVLGLLAVCGLLYATRGSRLPRRARGELSLCAWLSGALGVEAALAHPTFARYFLLAAPFAAVLAAIGLYAIVSRWFGPARPRWPVVLVLALYGIGFGRALHEWSQGADWSAYERLARKVDEVTPPGAPLFANEPIYFLTRRIPPPGLEFYYSHKLDLPPQERTLFHVLTNGEIKSQVMAGAFATAYSCDDDQIEDYGMRRVYKNSVELEDCVIFWSDGSRGSGPGRWGRQGGH
jgi:hypothetical protein